MARGTILLVDGYNVSMWLWPDVAATEQRARLVDALSELAARTGVEPWVVFDGSDEGGPPPAGGRSPRPARSPVKVRFSAPGVEADDVILELVDELPAARPVVVASDDRRVRDGADQGGAHVIGVGQLARLVRR